MGFVRKSRVFFDTSYRLHKRYGAAFFLFNLRSPLTYGLTKNQENIVKYPLFSTNKQRKQNSRFLSQHGLSVFKNKEHGKYGTRLSGENVG